MNLLENLIKAIDLSPDKNPAIMHIISGFMEPLEVCVCDEWRVTSGVCVCTWCVCECGVYV